MGWPPGMEGQLHSWSPGRGEIRCLQAETLLLQQDPLPAGLQLGLGVPVSPREVTAVSQFSFCGCSRLRPADSEQRERVWSLLRGLLETYSRLREEDQSFAVEVPCPGVSLALGHPRGVLLHGVLGCGEQLLARDFGAAPWSSGSFDLPLGLCGWVWGGSAAFPPPCIPGRGTADPPSAVRAVHRVPGAAGGAVPQLQPRAWWG